MIVQICSGTDPGLERSNNEDSVAFDEPTGLCILADGMGGHNAGEVASGMTTAFIKSEMRDWISQADRDLKPADVETALVQCVTSANSAIYNMSRTTPQYAGMGTTLVVGVFHGDTLILGHIGDSRCYRLRDGRLEQITKDHSVRQEQIDTGLMMSEQALSSACRNLVTRAVGVEESVQLEINQYGIAQDDVYLMCSDGLSEMASEETIAAILSGVDSLEEKAGHLIAAANAGGGRDNISVVLAQVSETPEKTELLLSARRAMHGVWSKLRGT